MKKLVILLLAAAALAVSCKKEAPLFEILVQLTINDEPLSEDDITINLSDGSVSFDAVTGASGNATFKVPAGLYTASASFKRSYGGKIYNYNGSTQVQAVKGGADKFNLPLTRSTASQLIIKEVYNGGCMDNAGSKNYQFDKYIIIYNNSDTEVDASNMCIAMAQISNTKAQNKYAAEDGSLTYEAEGWCPASFSIWWFQDGVNVTIPPYSQIVVAINGAIDHTVTYSNSVNLANADFCMYDPESGFNHASYYPAPSASIPANHYMKTYVFGLGTAWSFPMQCAAPFLIMPDVDIQTFVKNPANFDNKAINLSGNYAKIPQSWILDALDIWTAADETKYFGRFPAVNNTGYQVLTNKLGYTTYRNVDKEATEAIAENEGKLVYNYDGAVNNDDTDPSGIDAEASIANGAKIVYMDTNNSANDFHMRKFASIRK